MDVYQRPESHTAEGRSVQWAGHCARLTAGLLSPPSLALLTQWPPGHDITYRKHCWNSDTRAWEDKHNPAAYCKLFRWVSVYINCRYLYVSQGSFCMQVRPNKQLICSSTSNMLLLLQVPKNKLRMFSPWKQMTSDTLRARTPGCVEKEIWWFFRWLIGKKRWNMFRCHCWLYF